MKRLMLLAMTGFLSLNLMAQDAPKQEEGFVFTTVKENPITSIKNQNRAGTCWCYSTFGFLEAELLRMGKGEFDFAEMYTVQKTYLDRADKAVRTHGDVSFSQGGSFYDVMYGMKHYGLVPEEVMRPGAMYGDSLSNHTELSAVSDAVVAAIAKGRLSSLQTDAEGTPLWKKAIESIHEIYLGEAPDTFTYNGKEYTPMSFAESTGFNPDDYVNLASFSHQPFYEKFIIEVQDNWRWSTAYNLPIDEFMEVMNNAIDNGYTIAWGSDVSETGFTRNGLAVALEEAKATTGSDQERWVGKADAKVETPKVALPQEVTVTQEMRQEGYDRKTTTDDHGMHIYGLAQDQNGTKYFMVKNSWGETGKYKGTWYASDTFVKFKTMNIVVHKDALPKDIAKKLGIK